MQPTTESRLLALAMLGSGTAIGEMIEGHRGLVMSLAKKYSHNQETYEELVGEGHVADRPPQIGPLRR